MKDIDYIIAGQGLAGTLLAHFLLKENQKIALIDPGRQGTATQVAAGIINPITGRRYVKSWRVDELIPFARQTYRELEQQFDISVFHPRNIIRSLFNAREENDWMLRTTEPGYEAYMKDRPEIESYAEHTVPAFSYGEVQHSAQVDIGLLARTYRRWFKENDILLEESLDYPQLTFGDGRVMYKDLSASKLVFCEGPNAIYNPFFNHLPFGGAKGEVLIVKIEEADFEKILKHRVFIVPLADDTYWIGSTYNWTFDDALPTEQGKMYLSERLEEVLKVPYKIVDHRAAVRPTVKDRRPFLGRHPEFPQLNIFNGLGTKGASLGPFWARKMCDFLLKNEDLDPQVDIRRFN